MLFLIASHVVEVHDWDTTYKLGWFMAVVVTGYALLSSFSTGTKITNLFVHYTHLIATSDILNIADLTILVY